MVAHPFAVAGLLVALVAVAGSALPRLSFETGSDPFLDRTLPEHQVYEEVKRRFVSDETLLIAYEAQDVFSHQSLEAVRRIGDRLLELRLPKDGFAPIKKVDSLATLKDLVGTELSFRSEPLVPTPVPTAAEALAKIRERALKNPLIRENFLSGDLGMAAIVLRLDPDVSDAQTAATVKAVRAVLAEAAGWGGWSQAHFTGKRVVLDEISKAVSRDTKRFVPAALGCMLVLLLVFLRKVAGALLVAVAMVLSLVTSVALLPLLGVPVTYMMSVLYPLTMMLACATGIHCLSEFGQNAGELPPSELARHTLASLLVPSAMCTFTTMVGFASVGVSSIPGLRDFALVSPLMVLAVFVVTFCVMALAMRLKPPSFWMRQETLARSPAYDRFIAFYIRVVAARPKAFLGALVLVTAVALAGIPRLAIDSNAIEDLGREDVPIRVTTETVERRFAGIESLVVSVRADQEARFLEPEALRKLDEVERYLREEEGMDHVTSVTGFIKLMHQGFFAEDPKEHRVPDTRDQVAQLMLLNGDRRVDEFIDPARRWARLTARYREHSAVKQMALFDRIQARLNALFPPGQGYRVDVTGDSRMRILANRRVAESQTTGLGLAFVVIFAPIFVVLRSIRAGLLSIPSNVFPIIAVLGLMGWSGLTLTPQNTIMASVTLGLVVDDSIHFLRCFQEELRREGDLTRALEKTLRTKLAAVLVSTVVFAVGFSVLLLSEFPPVVVFGTLIAISMLLGLLGELFVLPPLILATRPNLVEATAAPPAPAAGPEAMRGG